MEKIAKLIYLLALFTFPTMLKAKSHTCDSLGIIVKECIIDGIPESSRFDFSVYNDSSVTLDGIYWKSQLGITSQLGIHLGFSSGIKDLEEEREQFKESLIVVLNRIEKQFPNINIVDVSSDLPVDFLLNLSRQLNNKKKLNRFVIDNCRMAILDSKYVKLLNECLLLNNYQIIDVEISNIWTISRKEFLACHKYCKDIIPSRMLQMDCIFLLQGTTL